MTDELTIVTVPLQQLAAGEMIDYASSLRSDTEDVCHEIILGDDVALGHAAYLAFANHRKGFDAAQCSMRGVKALKTEHRPR